MHVIKYIISQRKLSYPITKPSIKLSYITHYQRFFHHSFFHHTTNTTNTPNTSNEYVPKPNINLMDEILENNFIKKITSSRNLLCLTGAGLSTESGIPDYRSPKGSYSKGHKPIQFKEFISSEKNRKRYWARNMLGYRIFNQAKPNSSHKSLVQLEKVGIISHLVTQNVDNLHQSAGHKNVIDLHGNNQSVICLDCHHEYSRMDLQYELEFLNEEFISKLDHHFIESRSDGDANLSLMDYSSFNIPSCKFCGGILKPNVVFFGENVPNDKVEKVFKLVEECNGLFVIGSSLQVYSGYRFVKRTNELGKPIYILNIGPTRGDELATMRIEGQCGIVLPKMANLLKKNL